MIEHNNKSIPVFPEIWDVSDRDTIWVSWEDKLNGSSISLSEWTVPSGWNNHGEQTDQTALESGISYPNSNGVDVSVATAVVGSYVFANKVTFADGRVLERSVRLKLGSG